MEKILLYFAIKYKGNWDDVYKALDSKERVAVEELEKLNDEKYQFVSVINPLYPKVLKNAFKPPFILFFDGSISLLTNWKRIVGLFTSGDLSPNGERNFNISVKGLTEERKIIAIKEDDLNTYKTNTLVKENAQVVVILKNTLKNFQNNKNEIYRELQKIDFLLITEFGNEIEKDNTQYQNRLISGLITVALFVQLSSLSKTKELIDFVLNDGKELLAFPYDNFDKSNKTNKLIKQGAKLVENIDDIINNL
ncbi:DNA-processing protein DprA [Mesoplasma photuris]|uniref:DNA-processing protein DprA n=1 Tax=Mesoplasma photuris TaxID=217731 RepID=UPI0004E208DD|nr:DNA-processing protein DprA [Mesoplasma photuris]